jgi:hypothetical protein
MTTAADYNSDVVECRAFSKHTYERIPVTPQMIGKSPWKPSRTVFWLARRCVICETERYEVWNAITGEILFATYHYPDGYHVPKGKLKPKDFRKEFVKRDKPLKVRNVA